MPDDGSHYELVRGKLRRMTPAGNRHGYIAGELFAELRNHVKANNLGRTYAAETGFKVASDPDTVRAPDAAFISRQQARPSLESRYAASESWRAVASCFLFSSLASPSKVRGSLAPTARYTMQASLLYSAKAAACSTPLSPMSA
jgi:hypothetical protein